MDTKATLEVGRREGLSFILLQVLWQRLQARRQKQAKARLTREEALKRLEKLGEAEVILQNPTVKDLLCPALLSVSNDVFEITKTLTPILVGAIIVKTIVMPLDPLFFATIAIAVSRAGIASVCKAYVKK